MRGQHQRTHHPKPGTRYALLIDVAGEDETEGDALARSMLQNTRRDATAVTVVEIDWQYGQLPHYRTVDRHLWLGTRHTRLHDQIVALAHHWHAMYVIVDATGVGAGLASFLDARLGRVREGGHVIPVIFSPAVKSNLGWNFLAVVETGRYRDYAEDRVELRSMSQAIPGESHDTRQFWYEVGACQYEVRPGPGRLMKWGVTEAHAYDGVIARGHDDLLISAALCSIIDQQDWPGTGSSTWVEKPDALDEIDSVSW